MSQLAFYLLGSPWLERDGAPLPIVRRRALAVAIYLAKTGRRHSREQLMAIFWPELSPSDARADLRRTLHVLRRSLGDGWLATDAGGVRLDGDGRLWLDVDEFHRLLHACTQHGHPSDEVCDDCLPLLTRAADLYRDDFLAGFSLPNSPDFDAWHFFQAERLRAEMASVLARLVQGHLARRNHAEAISIAHRWLALDPLDESNHRRLMELHAESGQQALARRQYEQCVRLLQQELDAPPSPETEALHHAIQAQPHSPLPSNAHLQTDRDSSPAEPPPALDEIRLVTAVSIGLVERAIDLPTPALDERMEEAQTLLTIVGEAAAPYHGRIHALAGEDLLLFFGVDRVHEDDAERGVRAALAILAAAGQQGLALLAGVNSGMAYCRRPADGDPSEFTVMGPVVNLATRLRNRAGVGQVLAGSGAYRQTRGAFAYEAIATTLPGIEGPIPAYRVLRLRAHPTKVRGIKGLQAAMIGREDELQALHAIQTGVREEGRGHLAAIVADAGVGKSRLVAELKALVDPDTVLWLEGRGQAFTASTGYWLFTDMVRDYLSRQTPGRQESGETAVADVTAALHHLEQLGHLKREQVEEMGPLLGRLLSIRYGSDWEKRLAGVAAEQIRRRTLAALQGFFQAIAAEQPLVLVCEDLHWADPLSLDLIGALMETVTSVPLLILAVYRPRESQADGQLLSLARRRCPEHFTEVHLSALSAGESRQLVASLLAVDALPPSMRRLLIEKAEGNPLYLEEIVRTLIDGDVLFRDGAKWRARSSLASVTVPASLQSVILSRVDRLEAAEKAYLQAATVLGRLFLPRLVAAMQGAGENQGGTLAQLASAGLVHQERTRPEPEYSFHHVLVRDAIYQDLPRGYRVDLHRRAAHAIERHCADNLLSQVELLAHHYDLGDDAPKAVTYLLLAGRRALAAYLNQAARAHFERVLARLAELDPSELHSCQRLEALHGLGEVHMSLGNVEQAEGCLRQALTMAADLDLPARQRVPIILSLCQLLAHTGDNLGLVALCDQGMALIDRHNEPMAFVAFTTHLAKASANRGEWRLAMNHLTPIVEVLPGLPYSGYLVDAYHFAVLWCRFFKQVTWGFDLIAEAFDAAHRQHDLWGLSELYCLPKMFLEETVGDVRGVTTSIAESERHAEMAGNEMRLLGSHYWQGVLHGWLLGNLDEAERYARQDLQARGAMYQPGSYVFAYIVLGLVHYCRHNWAEALTTLERAHQLAKEDQFLVDGVRRGRVGLAWTYAMLGRKADGLALLAKIAAEEELHIESWPTVACALAGLEAMCADGDEYDSICRGIIAARMDEPLPLVQWRLQPAAPDTRFEDAGAVHKPDFWENPGLSGWTWHDQFGDCSYEAEDGALIICAANYHNLWLNNFAAPRLLRPATGDFAVQSICRAAYADRPALGGLLLWKDRENYLRLTWNTHAPDGVNLLGCVDNVDLLLGLGQLPDARQVFLRMERVGPRVRCLCSADGINWYSVGEVDFPVDDPAGDPAEAGSVEVGPLAIGMIHRYVHAGAWPKGSAIRFESMRMLSCPPHPVPFAKQARCAVTPK